MGGYGVGGEIVVVDEPTGRAIIQVDREGENSIVLFPGANHSEAVERAFEARGAGWFPPAACVLLQNEISPRATRYAMEHSGAAVVVYNPSPLPSPEELRALPWARVAWLVVNAAEARGVLAALDAGELGGADAGGVLARLAALPALRATGVVCTLGVDGVIAAVRGAGAAVETVRVGAAKLRGAVRDTTGAGDCFTGYFAQGVVGLPGGPGADAIARVLQTCVAAAGMCCEKRGTVDSIPVRAHVEARMRLA
ncbi:hypothetical protein HYPSUDRAFT_42112 [Hypholoma sublateritium FD-334 SS-4]|uniref:Carbohydrate kinase PfkB domain-containing protein n=1 Tax=Hypholoma sublateritium (strain FD-334 SS-4) TaxID=945553 RepID=A0A0D2NY90_HYPSF|nr:hypothetical protein HYPSUDRAFT_42112 [Hypholoma sublateritium FD-334 SS-4]